MFVKRISYFLSFLFFFPPRNRLAWSDISVLGRICFANPAPFTSHRPIHSLPKPFTICSFLFVGIFLGSWNFSGFRLLGLWSKLCGFYFCGYGLIFLGSYGLILVVVVAVGVDCGQGGGGDGGGMYYFIVVDILFYCDIYIILLCWKLK